jgi:hypothetical protein
MASKTTNKFSPEIRAGAVRMVLDPGYMLRQGSDQLGETCSCASTLPRCNPGINAVFPISLRADPGPLRESLHSHIDARRFRQNVGMYGPACRGSWEVSVAEISS